MNLFAFFLSYLDGPCLLPLALPEVVNLVLESPDLRQRDLDVLALEGVPALGEGVQRVRVLVELLRLFPIDKWRSLLTENKLLEKINQYYTTFFE